MRKLFLLLLFLLIACKELLTVPNISQEKIVFIQPKSEATFTTPMLQFRWEELENVDQYRFQLIHLKDAVSQNLLRDTLVDSNQFRDSLETNGQYRWRVRGENSGYSTAYTEAEFFLNTPHITNYKVELISPNDGIEITEVSPLFSWDGPLEIEQYRFQLTQPTFDSSSKLLMDTLLTRKNFRLPLTGSGAYEWRVRGENKSGVTNYSTRNFTYVDPLEQSNVHLVFPQNQQVLTTQNIRFQWDAIPLAKKYQIQIVRPDFNVIERFVSDSLLEQNHLQLTLEDNHQYSWRVRALSETASTAFTSSSFRIATQNDLANQQVTILAPSHNSILKTTSVNFNWESLEDADHYHIQIATPAFENAQQILVDKEITDSYITVSLSSSATYEWRVRAENSHSTTKYVTAQFRIE